MVRVYQGPCEYNTIMAALDEAPLSTRNATINATAEAFKALFPTLPETLPNETEFVYGNILVKVFNCQGRNGARWELTTN